MGMTKITTDQAEQDETVLEDYDDNGDNMDYLVCENPGSECYLYNVDIKSSD